MFARCCQQGRVSLHLCDTVLISSLPATSFPSPPRSLSTLPLCRFSVSLYLCLSLLFSSWTVWLLICLPICAFPIDIWHAFPPAFSTPFPPSNVARHPRIPPLPFHKPAYVDNPRMKLPFLSRRRLQSLPWILSSIASGGITPRPDSYKHT